MFTAIFHATPQRQTWMHRPGYMDGTTPVEPVILHDQESVEVDDFDKNWLLAMLPDNFVVL